MNVRSGCASDESRARVAQSPNCCLAATQPSALRQAGMNRPVVRSARPPSQRSCHGMAWLSTWTGEPVVTEQSVAARGQVGPHLAVHCANGRTGKEGQCMTAFAVQLSGSHEQPACSRPCALGPQPPVRAAVVAMARGPATQCVPIRGDDPRSCGAFATPAHRPIAIGSLGSRGVSDAALRLRRCKRPIRFIHCRGLRRHASSWRRGALAPRANSTRP
jgi:hypothetical protein